MTNYQLTVGVLGVILPIVGTLSIFFNLINSSLNKRIDDINLRFNDLIKLIEYRFDRMEKDILSIDRKLDDNRERLLSLEDRVSKLERKAS
jgi:Mg2+ and Co2+ transporter CorA